MVNQLSGENSDISTSEQPLDLNNIMGSVSNMLGGMPVENLFSMMPGMSGEQVPNMSDISNILVL